MLGLFGMISGHLLMYHSEIPPPPHFHKKQLILLKNCLKCVLDFRELGTVGMSGIMSRLQNGFRH